MERKQLEVACPCCQTRLLVDVRTGQLLRSLRPEQLDETGRPVVDERDWDDALHRVQGRVSEQDSRLDDALEREKKKGDRLDELFRQAKDRLVEDGDSDDREAT